MKKFGVINYCDDASCIPGLVGDLKDTPEEGMAEALRTTESYCDDEGCSKELIEPGDGKYSVDNCGCTHSFDMVEVDLNLNNLQELTMLLLKHRFEFRVEPVTQKMDFTDPDGDEHDLTIEHLERAVDVIFTKETAILRQYLDSPDMLTDCAFIDCAIFGKVTFG